MLITFLVSLLSVSFHSICFKAGSFLYQGIILILLISFIYFADLLMDGKGRFGTRNEENGIRSDCRLKIQGMSDFFVHEVSFLHILRDYHISQPFLVCMMFVPQRKMWLLITIF